MKKTICTLLAVVSMFALVSPVIFAEENNASYDQTISWINNKLKEWTFYKMGYLGNNIHRGKHTNYTFGEHYKGEIASNLSFIKGREFKLKKIYVIKTYEPYEKEKDAKEIEREVRKYVIDLADVGSIFISELKAGPIKTGYYELNFSSNDNSEFTYQDIYNGGRDYSSTKKTRYASLFIDTEKHAERLEKAFEHAIKLAKEQRKNDPNYVEEIF